MSTPQQHGVTAPLLASMVSPVGLGAFLRDYWLKRPLFAHGSLRRLSALAAVPELASIHTLVDAWRGDNNLLELNPSPTPDNDGRISRAGALRRYEKGLTLYLHGVEDHVPGLKSFLRELDADLGVRPGSTSCLAFASRVGSGAPAHFDPMHVFNVQLKGTKRWELAPNALPNPPYASLAGVNADGDPCRMPAPKWRVTARPGSVVYLPHGTWHRTFASRSDSFAIALIVNAQPWGRAIVDRLWKTLADHEEERRLAVFLRHRTPHAQLRARLQTTKARVTDILRGLTVDALLADVPDYAAAYAPGARHGVELDVSGSAPALRVAQPRRHLRVAVDAAHVDILRWLLAQSAAFSVRDAILRHIDDDYRAVIACIAQLERMGALVATPRARSSTAGSTR